ncbi:hypothetical protein ACFQV4_29200 [Streptomyces thermocarboxydus]
MTSDGGAPRRSRTRVPSTYRGRTPCLGDGDDDGRCQGPGRVARRHRPAPPEGEATGPVTVDGDASPLTVVVSEAAAGERVRPRRPRSSTGPAPTAPWSSVRRPRRTAPDARIAPPSS